MSYQPKFRIIRNRDGEEVLMATGYQFKDPSLTIDIGDRTIAADDFTHEDALLLMAKKPSWFKQNVVRGHYAENHPYWGSIENPTENPTPSLDEDLR